MKLKLLLIFLLWIPPLQAQDFEMEVRTLITQRDQEIKKALQDMKTNPSLREVARSLINDQIDFQKMGQLSLGRYYENLAPEEREQFINVFSGIVRAQSLSDLSVYEAPITIDSVVINGEQASVNTTTKIRDTNLSVLYHLHRRDNQWWVYDIIIDGVGTVEGYSVSFQTYLRKRGFVAFMKSLQKRLDATKE